MENCRTRSNKKIIVFKENRSRIEFLNTEGKEVEEVKVDGCEIKDGKRCDFLLRVLVGKDESESEHYVELKGSDVKHAMEQLRESIKQLKERSAAATFAYVVSSKCPMTTSQIQNYKKKFKNNLQVKLIVKNSPVTATI